MDKDFLNSPFYRLVVKTITMFNLTEKEKINVLAKTPLGMKRWLIAVLPQFTPDDVLYLADDEYQVLRNIGYKTEEEKSRKKFKGNLQDLWVKEIFDKLYHEDLTKDDLIAYLYAFCPEKPPEDVVKGVDVLLRLLTHPKVNFLEINDDGKITINLEATLQ